MLGRWGLNGGARKADLANLDSGFQDPKVSFDNSMHELLCVLEVFPDFEIPKSKSHRKCVYLINIEDL